MMNQAFNKRVGLVLRHFRVLKNFSQERLALDAELDRTYISLLERGLRQPSMKSIFLIAGALDVRASEIVEAIEQELSK